MKRTTKLIVAILILFTIVTISVSSFAVAEVLEGLQGDAQLEASGTVTTFGNNLVTLIRIGGVVIAVIILLILGIQYMMGSAEQKADFKKTMIPYLIGAILVFASTQIVSVVLDISGAVTKDVGKTSETTIDQ